MKNCASSCLFTKNFECSVYHYKVRLTIMLICEFLLFPGNVCTSSAAFRTTGILPWISKESSRTLEAPGKEETDQWNVRNPTRTSRSVEEYLCLLTSVLTTVIWGNENISNLNSSCFWNLQVWRLNYVGKSRALYSSKHAHMVNQSTAAKKYSVCLKGSVLLFAHCDIPKKEWQYVDFRGKKFLMLLLKCQSREFYIQNAVPPIDNYDVNIVSRYSRTRGRGGSDAY